MTLCRYIQARDAAEYHAQGWLIYPLKGHHGVLGRWLAVLQ